ncbi:uncharacterized protein UDID_19192 [Ustilago sp. UG-2017a]|nr:uncharacterized protein UDID_19192 [Ustilago sp. UG-2017a]
MLDCGSAKWPAGSKAPTAVAYSDADHTGSWKEKPYSTSGFVFTLFRGAVAWRSRRQRVISMSTAEAETVALSNACHDVIWILDVLNGLDITMTSTPITILTDNQAAERIISSDGPGRNKSLTLRSVFTKDTIKKGIVNVKWITGELQIADGLTKLLNARGCSKSREDLGVRDNLVARR